MTYKQLEEELEVFQSQMKEILVRKNSDYSHGDALSNFKTTAQITQTSTSSTVLNLIGVKVARLGVLINQSKNPKNEAIEDTLIDLANYTFLLSCVLRDIKIDNVFKP